ncbi:MAG: 4-oxalocrotonate tautomerase [Alphaproteobacteria bacterium]|nr:4-oxalocrotonate tautomerase [Alphaproteobacteria bacterium]
MPVTTGTKSCERISARERLAVTNSFVAICGSTSQGVHIVFAEVEKSDWATAGKLASDAAPAAAPAKS